VGSEGLSRELSSHAAQSRSALPPKWLDLFVKCCANLAEKLGLCPDPVRMQIDLDRLLRFPTTAYSKHLNWPSAMSVNGPPIEISIRMDFGRPPELRVVTDLTDHRLDSSDNWVRYVRGASMIAGDAAEELVWSVCRQHLDGIPGIYRSRMLHGLGYYRDGKRRASLYFRSWDTLTGTSINTAQNNELSELYGHLLSAGCNSIALYAYDIFGSDTCRKKAYGSITRQRIISILGAVCVDDRNFGAAKHVLEWITEDGQFPSTSDSPDFGGMLQVALEENNVRGKIYFACEPWAISDPTRLSHLFPYLSSTLNVDLTPLALLIESVTDAGIRLRPTYLACSGPSSAANISVYFAPDLSHEAEEELHAVSRRSITATSNVEPTPSVLCTTYLVDSAVRYLLAQQATDGLWGRLDAPDSQEPRDFRDQSSELRTTAIVGLALCGAQGTCCPLISASRGLASLLRDWDFDRLSLAHLTTASLVTTFIRKSGDNIDRGVSDRLLGVVYAQQRDRHRSLDGSLEWAVSALRSVLALAPTDHKMVIAVLSRLCVFQDETGFWGQRSVHPLVATAAAVESIRDALDVLGPGTQAGRIAVKCLKDTMKALRGIPVPVDSGFGSYWLRAWIAAGGGSRGHVVLRMLLDFTRSQLENGMWCSTEQRLDKRSSLITTSSVIRAIRETATTGV
jgi:hypothetical protein